MAAYTNRELDAKFKRVEEVITETGRDLNVTLNRIEVQTTTTNGRVNRLENWRSFQAGALAVITLIVIPLLGWALWKLSTLDDQVQAAVNKSLAGYEVRIEE